MNYFDGKIAIVTGATTGVGEGIAEELFHRGAVVIITGRQFFRARQTARRIDPTGRYVIPMETDVRDHLSIKALIDNTVERFGGLHMLVNNAGITGPHGINICDYSIDDWNDVINTNLSGTFFGLKYGIPAIIRSGGGAIVNLSSSNGIVGIPGIAPYTATKHGVLGLTRSAALEFADKGVRINAVGPGYVNTPHMQTLPAEVREWMANTHPMKRMATREEVAKMVAFLLSDESSFTTGAFYAIDGGYTAQ
ncbi:SDR family NAD(P)-dependent oxidoreductase [Xenorhabdus miraniensis]|uniref:Short-chain type dehydrogenase/reductase n=1 Tax=Xenorhabdus miraniensis TaxID=351674 RepID=A0A2D0JKP1_9GAMM|nr:SDR family NAD(P)-dependent oxidoreductase [Xenorhabdus miraniensis]PHM46643.1 short-chain type dehydrogenase/reductase [Xenorhabdus miraniensis]PHM46814.1 short-chain type dehydrogenase/reductase [Xenorhabdus miraniensis]